MTFGNPHLLATGDKNFLRGFIYAVQEIERRYPESSQKAEELANTLIEAGFRRRGPVTDAEVHKAYRGFCIARKGQELLEGEYEAVFSRVEFAWIQAALEAERSNR